MSSASKFQLKKRGQAKNSNKNKRARKCLFHSKDLKQHGEDGEVCLIDLTRSPDLSVAVPITGQNSGMETDCSACTTVSCPVCDGKLDFQI